VHGNEESLPPQPKSRLLLILVKNGWRRREKGEGEVELKKVKE